MIPTLTLCAILQAEQMHKVSESPLLTSNAADLSGWFGLEAREAE